MKRTVYRGFNFQSRFLLTAWIVILLVACGSPSSENPPVDAGGDQAIPDDTGDGGSQTPPGDTGDSGGQTPPDNSGGADNQAPDFGNELTINVGGDIYHHSYDEITISAGRTSATHFEWTQIGNGPRVNLINADSVQVKFLPPSFSGSTSEETRRISLRLTGWDDQGNSASDDIDIIFPPVPAPSNNSLPTIEDIPDVIAQPGEIVELTAVANDAEDGIPQIEWSQRSAPPLVLGSSAVTGQTISFVAPASQTKIWFLVKAIDSDGATALTDVLIEVMGNIAPIANAGGDMSVNPGQLVTAQGSGSDADGDIDSFQWQQVVDGAPRVDLQNASTSNVSFTAPGVAIATDITLELTVTDNLGATASDLVVITIDPSLINLPPTANAGADAIAVLGGSVTLVGAGDDADGSIVSSQWSQLAGPPITLTGADSSVVNFVMPEDMQGQSAITLQFSVTDNDGAVGIDQVVVTANSVPVANAGGEQFVKSGDTVNLLGSGSDTDGNIVSYMWTQIVGEPRVALSPNASSANTSFIAPDITASLSFELTVTDDLGDVSKDTAVIHIVSNIPPTADAGLDRMVSPGELVTISGNGSDSDGNVAHYSWTQIAGPSVALNGADSSTVSFNAPLVQQQSIVTLRLTVEDDLGATASDDVSITINAPLPNNTPVANAGVDQTVAGGELVTLSGLGTDKDLDPLIYSWRQTSGPSIGALPNTSVITFTAPQVATISTITIELTVTDDKGASGSDLVIITVEPTTNLPPIVDIGSDFAVLSGNNVTITGNANDPDGQIIQYSWTKIAGPAVTLEGTDTSVVNFIAPVVSQPVQLHLRLSVVDDQGASAADEVFITVNPADGGNTAPVVSVGGDIVVIAGSNVSITGTVTDDNPIVVHFWTQISGAPSLSMVDQITPTVSFVAPDVGSQSSFTLRLTAIDEIGAVGFDEIVITVLPASGANNVAPNASAGIDRVVSAGNRVTIAGTGNDSDGSIASYEWTQVNGINVTLNNANSSTVSFDAPAVTVASNITLRLTVTDNLGAVGEDDVIIMINPTAVNIAPSANAGADRTVESGQAVTLTGSGIDEPGGAIVSYSWSQVSGEPLTLNNTTNATLQFNAPPVQQQATATLRLTVTDNLGATGFDEVIITINPITVANIPPTANAGPNRTITAGDIVSIDGSGNDQDGNIVSYRWAQVSGVPLTLNGILNSTVEFSAPPVQTTSTATLRLTVVDNLEAAASDDVTITINPAPPVNQPPLADAGPDLSVNGQDFVVLTGNGSDNDGTVTSFVWTQSAGPAVTINNSNTANANFRVPQISVATDLEFMLTVTDNAGATHSDTVLVKAFPFTQLSGTITTQSGTQVDSDTNDPSAAFASNTTPGDAQPLFNPVILGGYVNRPGAGAIGRSQVSGDIDDYYSITLSANQLINLYIGDIGDVADPNNTNNLDLMLLNQTGTTVVDASVSPTATVESLVVPASGNYLINVKAIAGASNYVLSVGVSNLSAQSNGWRLSDDFEPGDVIVKFKENPGIASAQNLVTRAASVGLQAKAGATGRNMLLGLGNANQKAAAFFRLGLQQAQSNIPPELLAKWETLQAAISLANRNDVEEAGLNYRYYPTAVPNDSNYNLQWHYPLINLPQAWDITTGSSNVIVAVIDTGVLLNHPDLQGQLVPGYDFIASNANSGDGEPGIDANPDDPGDGGGGASSFHGTHVAGTIAAASNNGVGVAGIAWGVKIMPCRAVGINGGLRYDIEQCVRYVSGLPNDSGTMPAQPADVINLSLGGPTNTTSAPAAYRLARDAGVVVVAAAGNDSSSALFAPASYNGVVSVSAVNISRRLASYSNFGSTIDVAAPGGDSGDLNGDGFFDGVLSTGGDDSNGAITFNYRFAAGTSMASPHMAGVIALMKSVYPDLTPDRLDAMLQNGELTDDLGTAGRDNNFGYGLINAQKAVLAAANNAVPTPPPLPAAELQLSTTTLNLGVALTSAQFSISNAGSGTLDITSISNDSSGWLSVSPASIDANGLGTYSANVNRTGLLNGLYTATITIASSAGTQTVSVIMQVDTAAASDNAGFHYIELIDMETMQLFDRVISSGTNGVYQYTFASVPLGVYHIQAGSDVDNDGLLCEMGDACGAFPTLDIISQHINVDGSATSINNLNFTTGFGVNLINP